MTPKTPVEPVPGSAGPHFPAAVRKRAQKDAPRRALRTAQAAAYLGVSASLLRKMRSRGPDDPLGQGPPFIKLSAALVVYEIDELDRWLDSRRRVPAVA